MEGTSNFRQTMPACGSAVSHGKMEGTSNVNGIFRSEERAVSHGKMEGTSNTTQYARVEHPLLVMIKLRTDPTEVDIVDLLGAEIMIKTEITSNRCS